MKDALKYGLLCFVIAFIFGGIVYIFVPTYTLPWIFAVALGTGFGNFVAKFFIKD